VIEEILVVHNLQFKIECIKYFETFKKQFKYLENIDLKFTPDESYTKYETDLEYINSGTPELISLIDTRDLVRYKNDPIRLFIKDGFFKISDKEKDEQLLHELGHFFTNDKLKKIRKIISEMNFPKISTKESKYQTDLHNKGLAYLTDIIKLPQEVNAEKWVNQNEANISSIRFKRFCEGINSNFTENDKTRFFYIIPFLNYHILLRYALINKINFKSKHKHLMKLDMANKQLHFISKKLGWANLKQLSFQKDILKSVQDEDYSKLISLFEDMFNEYIIISSSFFPKKLQKTILKIYFKNSY